MDGNNVGNNSQNGNSGSQYQDHTANIPYQVPMETVGGNKANGLQIAGLVCGILAICTCWCYGIVGIILGVAGLICSVIGNKSNKNGIGVAGFVCSIIGLVLGILSLIYFVWIFIMLGSGGYWGLLEELGRY